MVECLVSGRRRFVAIETLEHWWLGAPPVDPDSLWRAEELFARRRAKLLQDVDLACVRGLRRGVLDARGVRVARAFMEALSSARA